MNGNRSFDELKNLTKKLLDTEINVRIAMNGKVRTYTNVHIYVDDQIHILGTKKTDKTRGLLEQNEQNVKFVPDVHICVDSRHLVRVTYDEPTKLLVLFCTPGFKCNYDQEAESEEKAKRKIIKNNITKINFKFTQQERNILTPLLNTTYQDSDARMLSIMRLSDNDAFSRSDAANYKKMIQGLCGSAVFETADMMTQNTLDDMEAEELRRVTLIKMPGTDKNLLQFVSDSTYTYFTKEVINTRDNRRPMEIYDPSKPENFLPQLVSDLLKYACKHIEYDATIEFWTKIASRLLVGFTCEGQTHGGRKKSVKLEKLTVKELQERCVKRKIKYSGLRKAELIVVLRAKK